MDLGSFIDVLYYDAFKWIELDPEHLHPFKGSLVGFLYKQMQVGVHASIRMTCWLYEN